MPRSPSASLLQSLPSPTALWCTIGTLLALVVLVPVPVSGQETAPAAPPLEQVTAADYERAERFLARSTYPLVDGMPTGIEWLEDGRAMYRVMRDGRTDYVVVDPSDGERRSAFDSSRLADALATATGEEVDADRLPLRRMTFDDGRLVTTLVGGDQWTCDLASYTCAAVAEDGRVEAPRNSVVSPDGSMAAFIRDHDLWALNLDDGTELRLTTDGLEDFGYATNNAGWVRRESPVLTWSPDSRRIATFQHDGRGVSMQYLVRTKVGEPELEAWRYPLPGDSVIFRIHRVVIDVAGPDGPSVTRLDMPPDAHRSTVTDHVACGTRVCDLEWFPDGSAFAFVSSSRDHRQAWVRVADAETGEVRTLFEETSETQIGDASMNELWRVLPASNELIWWSQRDDWIHLYLYDLETGALKNRITSGRGNVQDVLHVDEEARTIWFVGQAREGDRDPYFEQLYRVDFDGSDLTLLTPEPAQHEVSLSPDAAVFIDSYSTPDTPPVTVMRDARTGSLISELERSDISRLLATGWRPPTPVTVKGRDGTTDIYGLMYTPTDLDSTRVYPVVNYIYPGPQSGSVGPRRFLPARGDHQALAELGFVVVTLDGMGTPGRSKSFHDAYYGNMSDNTLPDQVAGIRELAERYPFLDIENVGVWGHSGGGFAAAQAMFRYPDFYDVGIAESGNHDNRNYEDDWGERYQGLLERDGDTDNYAEEANQSLAANLEGKLMLVHGGMDSNVPPSNTYLVAEALMEANRSFDMLVIPNAGHGFGRLSNYMTRIRWDYFVEHLKGAEPPDNYEIGRPPPPVS